MLWNFTLNRKFTFKSANNVPLAMLLVAGYYLVFTPLSTWWTAVLTEPDYGILMNEYIVLAGTMLINFVTEFLFDRFVEIGKSIDSAVKPDDAAAEAVDAAATAQPNANVEPNAGADKAEQVASTAADKAEY